MKTRVIPEHQESPRFINQQGTINTLNAAQERLDSLNEDYYDLSLQDNPRLKTQPYEGAVLFSVDKRPTNRASTLLHSPADELGHTGRLRFSQSTLEGKRIILSQSALQSSLIDGEQNRSQTFHSSLMNPDEQIVWAQPLVHEGENVAAVQLAYTINQTPEWIYPSNDDVDKIWEKHRKPMAEVAKDLAALSLKTDSLSKSLEIMPPITSNAFVIQWDVVNSRANALTSHYATQEAYLETWKAARAEITKKLGVAVLDRGDGEFIVLPIEHINVHNRADVGLYAKREILPVINQLVETHNNIAAAYEPTLFEKIRISVGLGNIEEDQDGQPTGQVLYELKNLADSSAKPLSFSPQAEKLLY